MVSNTLDDMINRYKLNNSAVCQFFGVRSTYGLLPDYREQTIRARIQELQTDIPTLKSMISKEKNDFHQFELKLVLHSLESELFNLSEIEPHKKFITVYAEPIANIIMVYASRSYAPIDERIRDIIKQEQAISQFLRFCLLQCL